MYESGRWCLGFYLVSAFGLFLFFPCQSPLLAGGNWKLALILWLPLKFKFTKAMHLLSSSREEAVTELCHLFIWFFAYFCPQQGNLSCLSAYSTWVNLLCRKGVCVCSWSNARMHSFSYQKKEKTEGKNQSRTGKELNCIKPNIHRSCVTFDSYYVLSLARSIGALPDGSVGYTKC